MRAQGLRARSSALGVVAAVSLALLLSSCANSQRVAPTEADTRALTQLAAIAVTAAELDATEKAGETVVECQLPSANPIVEESLPEDATTLSGDRFRVICRVHFEQAEQPRYRDVTCIGDFTLHEVADRCYRWAYYPGSQAFEDQRAYPAN